MTVSYRPEKRRLLCKPWPKCQMIRFRKLQLTLLENRGKFNVQRCNLSVVHKITYLPAKATCVFQARTS